MALALANAGPAATLTGRKRTIAASVREVANLLGDTPAVARGSYIDPRLIARYEADGVSAHRATGSGRPPCHPRSRERRRRPARAFGLGQRPPRCFRG